MNLSAYDGIKQVNYLGTWVDPRYKRMYSRVLPYYKFYSFAKKYNPIKQCTDFYLILHNELNTDLAIHSVYVNNNVMKIYLKDIWNETSLRYLTYISNITLTLEDKQDDCVIYFLDI